MNVEAIQMRANDSEDDDDDFLPPGFIPGVLPLAMADLRSPSIDENMKSPHAGSYRKEFLRRSISALDTTGCSENDGFVDLLGLRSMQKENISNNVETFWLQNTDKTNHPSIAASTNHDKSFTGSIQAHDAMEISYFHPSPDNGINTKLDELAADLEAEVIAGNLFLEGINTPLLSKSASTNNRQGSIDLLTSTTSTHNMSNMKRENAQLNEELQIARREAMVQRERATQLEIELQQLAISSAAEHHIMQEKCSQYEKEVEYMASKMKEAVQILKESEEVNEKLTTERDKLVDRLRNSNNQIAKLKLEHEAENFQFKDTEAKLMSDLHAARQMFTELNEAYEPLKIQVDDLLGANAALEAESIENKKLLQQCFTDSNKMSEKLSISELRNDELKQEVLNLNEMLQSKDDTISTYINAAEQGHEQKLQLSIELMQSKSRVDKLVLERDNIQASLSQLLVEKTKLDEQYIDIQSNLNDEISRNKLLRSNNESLQEQLRQAEDLALLVAADNDNMQHKLIVLQKESESLQKDKVIQCDSMEKLIVEKDQKIRSLQRLVGAIQCLFDDSSSTDKSDTVRSLQRRFGALKEEYEERILNCNTRKDEEISGLQKHSLALKHSINMQALDWKVALSNHVTEVAEDKAKIRNLKRRIGATESLLNDTENEATEEQNDQKQQIRNLQRRIGGLVSEVQHLMSKQNTYVNQIQENENLKERLTEAESSIASLRDNIIVLQDDLQDAYEREDKMQEDFVQAMTYATAEIEKLHTVYTHVLNHIKEQNNMVEDELFDALEREEDLTEMQKQLISEHEVKLINLQELVRNRLIEAAECSERIREECLLSAVDMFKACHKYFQDVYDRSIASTHNDHLLYVNELNESHTSDMVNLFRNVICAQSNLLKFEISDELSVDVHDNNEEKESLPIIIPSKRCNDANNATTDGSTQAMPSLLLQSPRSAFVSYKSTTASKIPEIESILDCSSTDRQLGTESLPVFVKQSPSGRTSQFNIKSQSATEDTVQSTTKNETSVPEIAKQSASGRILQCNLKIHHAAKDAVQSIGRTDSAVRKSLNFTTPEKEIPLVKKSELYDRQEFQSNPKITAVKSKLRSILALQPNVSATCKHSKAKSDSKGNVDTKDSVSNRKATINSSRAVCSSKLSHPVQRGVSCNTAIAVPPRNANFKKSVKPKLDTGMVKPKHNEDQSRPTTTSVAELKKPTAASSNRCSNSTAGCMKQKSRLPQFTSSRTTTSSNIVEHSKSRIRSDPAVAVSKSTSSTALYQKLSDLSVSSSTPLTARSKRSDIILANSSSKIPVPSSGLQLLTPKANPPSSVYRSSNSNECHFTPIGVCDESLDAISPVSPLVTPKLESLRKDGKIKETCSTGDHKAINTCDAQTCPLYHATKIQALVRGHFVRQTFEGEKKAKAAAKIIIRTMRLWNVRMKQRKMKQKEISAIVLQNYVRTKRQRCLMRLLLQQARCVTLIQRVWRGASLRKEVKRWNDAAVKLQQVGRMVIARQTFSERKNYRRLIDAAIVLQRKYRQHYYQNIFSVTKYSAIQIQCCFRIAKSRTVVNSQRLYQKCVVLIQSMYRQRMIRQKFVESTRMILRIQKFIRSQLKQKAVMRNLQKAAIILQRNYRMYMCHANYRLKTSSATRIQCWLRGSYGRTVAKNQRSLMKNIVLSQAMCRRSIARNHFVHTLDQIVRVQQHIRRQIRNKKAAIRIQSACRSFVGHRRYKATLISAKNIQSAFRRHCAFKRARSISQHNAARKIQAFIRMKIFQSQYLSLRYASLLIQAQVRGNLARQHVLTYRKVIKAIVCFQAQWRRCISRDRYINFVNSICRIQRHVRRYLHRRDTRQMAYASAIAITKIQRAWRSSRSDLRSVTTGRVERRVEVMNCLPAVLERGTPQLPLSNIKNGNRVVFGDLHSSVLKLYTNRGNSNENDAMSTLRMNTSDKIHNLKENQSNILSTRNSENEKPERKGSCKINRTELAAENLSTALRRVSERTYILDSAFNEKGMLNEIEKLKVVELRHELKSYGVESKSYCKLRKAELVRMVFEHRSALSSTTN